MPLPVGSWQAFVNGKEGQLVIDTVDAIGRVSGNLNILLNPQFPAPPTIVGLWEEAANSLMFFWADRHVVFHGCKFQTPDSAAAGVDITHTLTGHCVVYPVPPNFLQPLFTVTARRSEFGWYARITQVV